MKRFLVFTSLISACTSGPKEKTLQPAFDTLELTHNTSELKPEAFFSIKIAKDGHTWMATAPEDYGVCQFGEIDSFYLDKKSPAYTTILPARVMKQLFEIIHQSPIQNLPEEMINEDSLYATGYVLWLRFENGILKKVNVYGCDVPELNALRLALIKIRDTTTFQPFQNRLYFGTKIMFFPTPPLPAI